MAQEVEQPGHSGLNYYSQLDTLFDKIKHVHLGVVFQPTCHLSRE